MALVDRAGSHHTRVELDFAERAFISSHILLQDCRQSFRLLRAQIDTLEIADFHLGFALLLQGTEYQEEIPDVDPHLHAVGVVLAILGSVDQFDVGLSWIRHRKLSVAGFQGERKAEVPACGTATAELAQPHKPNGNGKFGHRSSGPTLPSMKADSAYVQM